MDFNNSAADGLAMHDQMTMELDNNYGHMGAVAYSSEYDSHNLM